MISFSHTLREVQCKVRGLKVTNALKCFLENRKIFARNAKQTFQNQGQPMEYFGKISVWMEGGLKISNFFFSATL